MNKTLLAAGLSLAMTSTGAWAAGIQIDPTGAGLTGGSFIANNLGSDFGDALFDSLMNAVGGNSGTVYAHSVFDLGSLDGGELTFVMWMETESSPATTPGGLVIPNVVTFTNPLGFSSYFALYYDPLDGGASSGLAANHDFGTNYDDGVLLATGTVAIDLNAQGTSSLRALLDSDAGEAPLDAEAGAIPSAAIDGNIFLNVEFDSLPGLGTYLVNNLITLDIDLEANGGLRAPYEDRLASDVVGGTGGGSLDPGPDGENDFTCAIPDNQEPGVPGGLPPFLPDVVVDQDCDVQTQITTVLDFNAESVPEPTTLGLIGAGLGLAGYFSRRRKGVA